MKKNAAPKSIFKKIHENKSVALTPDEKRIIAYSDKLIDLTEKVAGKDVVFMKVHPMDIVFAF